MFAAVTAVLGRIAGADGVIVVIDDAHLAGQAFADWLAYVLRRPIPVLVVVGARPAEGPELPATDEIGLGPLDRDQVAELVGNERADDLYDRSGGHPLFLSELAAVPAGELASPLVEEGAPLHVWEEEGRPPHETSRRGAPSSHERQ